MRLLGKESRAVAGAARVARGGDGGCEDSRAGTIVRLLLNARDDDSGGGRIAISACEADAGIGAADFRRSVRRDQVADTGVGVIARDDDTCTRYSFRPRPAESRDRARTVGSVAESSVSIAPGRSAASKLGSVRCWMAIWLAGAGRAGQPSNLIR